MINRTALIVRAKEPFLQWLKSLPDPPEHEMTLDSVNLESLVYLVPEIADDGDEDRVIELAYKTIFENELGGWWTDPNDWPEIKNREQFNEWFEVALHSCIEDLVGEPLIDEEF